MSDLPPHVLAQLSCIPEERPSDFECVVCRTVASNRWNHSPKDYERPPICKHCERVTGYTWTGQVRNRTLPTGGTFRDRREAGRIAALADAIAIEAQQQEWRKKHGRA